MSFYCYLYFLELYNNEKKTEEMYENHSAVEMKMHS
jgi:hypothetical protein